MQGYSLNFKVSDAKHMHHIVGVHCTSPSTHVWPLSRMLGNIQAMFLVGWRLCKIYESGKMSLGQASLCKDAKPVEREVEKWERCGPAAPTGRSNQNTPCINRQKPRRHAIRRSHIHIRASNTRKTQGEIDRSRAKRTYLQIYTNGNQNAQQLLHHNITDPREDHLQHPGLD